MSGPRRHVLAAAVLVASISATQAEQPVPVRPPSVKQAKGLVTGWGGGVISRTITALWLAGHDGPDVKPLALVYFHGKPNWHFREWSNEFTKNATPGYIKLVGEGLELALVVDIDEGAAEVEGQVFSRREHNVFLVADTDDPESRRVVPLGAYDLEIESEKPLPRALLERHDALKTLIREELTGGT